MKQFLATLSLLAFLTNAASAQGIDFFHGTWAEALEKAKSENKLIFVDAYASWCGPCKRMSKDVFPQEKAGEVFNSAFVNLKIDMEKPENAEFAGKFPVAAYPTLMFIDANGKLVHKETGARDVDGLIELAKKALGKGDQSKDFEKAYNEGKRDPQLMFDYVSALNRAGKPSLKITNEYLATQKDLTTPFNLKFLVEGTVEADSRVFDLLVRHRDAAIKQQSQETVEKRLESACRNTVKKAIEFKSEELLGEAKAKMKLAVPARADDFAFEAEMSYYANVKDAKKYLKSAQTYRKDKVKNNALQLHSLVINLIRAFPKDEKVMEQAEDWAKTAAENGGQPDYYLTLAEVYKRQGKTDKARQAANKAKEAAGDDASMANKVNYFLMTLE